MSPRKLVTGRADPGRPGERYAGTDHAAAAELPRRVGPELAPQLRRLIDLEPDSPHGDRLLAPADRKSALHSAQVLVLAATERVG